MVLWGRHMACMENSISHFGLLVLRGFAGNGLTAFLDGFAG